MLKNALYGGVNAAAVTAMNDDLSIDLDRMVRHCKWLMANGCNGLAVLGTTGEANSLGVEERMNLLDGLVANGIPGAKMLPGTGTTAIPDTVKLTRHAEAAGCRGALLLPPFYYKNPSEDGLLAYFQEVAQRVGGDIKLYLYNFPAQSAIPFTVQFIDRLLKACPGKFQGIKDSTGNWENSLAYADAFAKDGFEVYVGDDSLLHPILQKNGAGCITAASNVNCSAGAAVYANWDNEKGAIAHEIMAATRKAVTSVPLIPALKTLVARNTGDARWTNIRPPHTKLTEAQAQALFTAFDASGVQLAPAV